MSDIHGQSIPFEEALGFVDFSDGNQLVLCGDYIDHDYQNDLCQDFGHRNVRF